MVERLPEDLNGYRFLELLGEGTFGKTYLVEHIKSTQRYAMKVPKDMKTMQGRGNSR